MKTLSKPRHRLEKKRLRVWQRFDFVSVCKTFVANDGHHQIHRILSKGHPREGNKRGGRKDEGQTKLLSIEKILSFFDYFIFEKYFLFSFHFHFHFF